VQHPRQGRQPIRRRPALLDVRGDVEQAVAADPVRLRVRPGQHPRPQLFPLRRGQILRPPRPRAVVQPRQAFSVVAQHRVPQRLAFPPHDPGRVRPARSLQSLRDGQRPQSRTPVRLALREPPQLGCAHVVPDHQAACSHCSLLRRTDRKATTLQPTPDITTNHNLRQLVSVRSGGKVHVLLPGTLRTTYVVAAKLSDIQPNSFIGTAAAPQPDGTLKALEVHVFPPSMRGTGEGFRPYDLDGVGSTMTNGTVGSLVGTSGRVATLRYGNEEKQVLIPEDVPVVSFEPTDRSALKAGAKVVVNGQRAADGTVTVATVNIGKDGLTPPM